MYLRKINTFQLYITIWISSGTQCLRKNKFKDADICSNTTKKSKGMIKQIQHFAPPIRKKNRQDEICIETTMAKVDRFFFN